MNPIDLANAGSTAILLVFVVALWRELRKCQSECGEKIRDFNSKISFMTGRIGKLEQEIRDERLFSAMYRSGHPMTTRQNNPPDTILDPDNLH